MTELLRVLPMSVQDLVDEWFENQTLKAAIAAAGVRDIRQGPRSGGTSFVLLHHLVGAPPGSVRARGWWKDGPDAFMVTAEALARKVGVAPSGIQQISVNQDPYSAEFPRPGRGRIEVITKAGSERYSGSMDDPGGWTEPSTRFGRSRCADARRS
jgi:hypothetical protein